MTRFAFVGCALVAGSWPPASGVALPEAFRDAPAVVLEDDSFLRLNTLGSSEFHWKVRTFIRTRAGFDAADQSIVFDDAVWTLVAFSARTILPDGRQIAVPESLVRTRVLAKNENVNLAAQQFTFPGVTEGCTIEWELTFESSYGQWPEWTPQREIPVVRARRSLEIDGRLGGDWYFRSFTRADPSPYCSPVYDGSSKGKIFKSITCSSLPALEIEPDAPPEEDVRIAYRVWFDDSATPHGHMVANSLRAVFDKLDAFTATREGVAAWARATIDAAGDSDLVAVLYDATRARIAARAGGWWSAFGTAPDEPKNVDEALERRSAVTPDRSAVLLAALLSAGVKAEPILAIDRRSGRFDPDATNLQDLQRMLLIVREGENKTRVLDPECEMCPAGVVDWPFAGPGCGGFLRAPSGRVGFGDLPGIEPRLNFELRRETVSLGPGGAWRSEGTLSWQGLEAVRVRMRWMDVPEERRKADLQDMLFGGPVPTFSAELPLIDPSPKAIVVSYGYDVSEPAISFEDALLVRVPFRAGDFLDLPITPRRFQPLWWKYARSRGVQLTVRVPEGWVVRRLPPPARASARGAVFDAAWEQGKDGRDVTWSARLRIDEPLVPSTAYPDLLRLRGEIASALREGVALERAR